VSANGCHHLATLSWGGRTQLEYRRSKPQIGHIPDEQIRCASIPEMVQLNLYVRIILSLIDFSKLCQLAFPV
jgi:hypothetical protein